MKKTLGLKIFLLIFSTDIGESLGQLFLKKGILQIGIESIQFSNVLQFLGLGLTSPLVWLGIFFYGATFFIWIVVLCKTDLSVAMPVGSASYILIPLLAMLFLGESIPLLRWIGILLIIVGIYFVSKSPQKTIIGDHV